MNKLIAILSFALSLYGCEMGGNTTVQRGADGESALHSRVVARPGLVRFECLRSASGHCHYTLYPRDCDGTNARAATAACGAQPLERFSLASGRSRQIVRLEPVRGCVSSTAATGSDCGAPVLLGTP